MTRHLDLRAASGSLPSNGADRKHLSVAGIEGDAPKAGDPVTPPGKPRRVRDAAPDDLIYTSDRTGFTYSDGNLYFWKAARFGRCRKPKWRMVARRTSKNRLLFRSKRALSNYDMVMPGCCPSDFDLMERAFLLHSRNTQVYRRDWKKRELAARGTAHDHKARWLDSLTAFDEDCCLFFPNAKAGQPVKLKYNYRDMTAAKAMLIKTQGLPDDPAALATHKCGMGHMSCVNPRHLAWGSHADNASDRTIHNAAAFNPLEYDRTTTSSIADDPRMTKVIAWEKRLPAGLVSAIKTERFYEGDPIS